VNERLIGRAAFLGLLGAGVAGLFFARDVTRAVDRLLPENVSSAVSTGGWRIYTIADRMPDLVPADYRLTVDGLAGKPASFTLDDLKALPRADQVSDFHCVTGWSVDDVHWAGVRIADVLGQVAPAQSVTSLRFVSAEAPYEDSLTVEQALLPDVMLAYEMDQGPISRPHGAPVRLVMPRMYGYKSVKWVTRIELRAEGTPGYWERHGYDADAWVGDSNGL
jgi:DMSO/TMAO reductase YedYZ molybdopterin-dependent catalytic subunit